MTLKNLSGKNIAFLGFGAENEALIKFLLAQKITCRLTVHDQRSAKELGDKFTKLQRRGHVQWRLKTDFITGLSDYDWLFRSPGWPRHCPHLQKARRDNSNLRVESPMNLFLALSPSRHQIGVTGTKGKGTTASLIAAVLRTAGKKVFLGGNIGTPPFSFIHKLTKNSWVVLELSSFQLEDLEAALPYAVITNLSPEHLAPADPLNPNYHRSLSEYYHAKFNIFRLSPRGSYLVANARLRRRLSGQVPAARKVVYFSSSDLQSRLPGAHNKENVAAAVALGQILKISNKTMAKAVKHFRGLPHRLQPIRKFRGVRYYDDSFATTPEAAITALNAFAAPVILIAGGADKGSDFKRFAKAIKEKTRAVCLLDGQATPRLQQALLQEGYVPSKIKHFHDMSSAVQAAARAAVPGDIALLATGCASFGLFKNYKQRGELFQQAVRGL